MGLRFTLVVAGLTIGLLQHFAIAQPTVTESVGAPPPSGPTSPASPTSTPPPSTDPNAPKPITIKTMSTAAPVQVDSSETLQLLGQAAGNVSSQASPAGSSSLGFEYSKPSAYFRFRASTGLASYDLKDGSQKDYANMILQPDVRGFSLGIDAAWYHAFSDGRSNLAVGGSARLSPTNITWTSSAVIDPKTNMPDSQAATTVGLSLGLGYAWRLSTQRAKVSFEGTGNFSLRALVGDAANDQALLLATLGSTDTLFVGGEIRIKVVINGLQFFASMPFLYATGNSKDTIAGLTGVRGIFGLEINGNIYTWEVGAKQAAQARAAGLPARPTPVGTRPHFDF